MVIFAYDKLYLIRLIQRMTLENCLLLNDLFNYFGKPNNKNESITGFGTRKWNNLKHVAEVHKGENRMCPMQ